jgi:hypothetical protein
MEIASQHPKGQRIRAGQNMEERFFLDGVALQYRHIPIWHTQFTALIEPHLTDPSFPLADHTTMPACEASHHAIAQFLIQLPAHGQYIEHFTD